MLRGACPDTIVVTAVVAVLRAIQPISIVVELDQVILHLLVNGIFALYHRSEARIRRLPCSEHSMHAAVIPALNCLILANEDHAVRLLFARTALHQGH